MAARLAEAADISRPLNPELSAEFRVPRSRDQRETEVEVSIEQPLRLSGSALRAEVKALLAKAASSEQRVELLDVSERITTLYTELWAQQEETNAIERARTRLTRTAAAVRRAAEQGLLSGGEASFFAAQATELQSLRLQHVSEGAATRAELIRFLGAPITASSLEKPGLPTLPAPDQVLDRAAENKYSERRRLRLLERTAERQLQLAEREALPDITPRLVYEHADDGSDRFGAGVSFPLPFYRRNQSEIARRRAALSEIRARLSYTEEETFQAELYAVHQKAQASAERAALYVDQVIPKLRTAVSQQEAQFERGQGSVLQLWQMQQELLRAELETVVAWQAAIQARLELWSLLGEEF
jgi:outer membrane protein TolC